MGLFSKKTEKRMAAYQQELLKTHYREVETMYREMRGWRHDFSKPTPKRGIWKPSNPISPNWKET